MSHDTTLTNQQFMIWQYPTVVRAHPSIWGLCGPLE